LFSHIIYFPKNPTSEVVTKRTRRDLNLAYKRVQLLDQWVKVFLTPKE
jgi:hypothetical protein